MKSKKTVYTIYPDMLKAVSMNNLAMTELLLNQLLFSKSKTIRFHINHKLRLVECNDSEVKATLDLLLKTGRISSVREQLIQLIHREDNVSNNLGKLLFLIDDQQVELTIKEEQVGEDFTWRIIRE